MNTEWQIGDSPWIFKVAWRSRPKPCPVCGGSRRLLVRPAFPADAEETAVDCEYCAHLEGPSGVVSEDWAWEVSVHQVKLQGMECGSGRPTQWRYNMTSCGWTNLTADRMFVTREAAEAAGQKALLAVQEEQERANAARDIALRKYERGRAGWAVGYHRWAIQNCRKEVEHHRLKLGLPAEEFDRWEAEIAALLPKPRLKRKKP